MQNQCWANGQLRQGQLHKATLGHWKAAHVPPPLAQAQPRSKRSRQNCGSTPTPCFDKPMLARDTHDSKAWYMTAMPGIVMLVVACAKGGGTTVKWTQHSVPKACIAKAADCLCCKLPKTCRTRCQMHACVLRVSIQPPCRASLSIQRAPWFHEIPFGHRGVRLLAFVHDFPPPRRSGPKAPKGGGGGGVEASHRGGLLWG